MMNPQKIFIIGNACAGKTVLAQKLAKKYNLPLIHVDSLQYDSHLQINPHAQTLESLAKIQNSAQWIIDGYGPLDDLINRLNKADLIIFIDPPLWRNYFWASFRVIKNIFQKSRTELPRGSSERNLSHIIKLFKSIHQIHYKMRPELLRILDRPPLKTKVRVLRSASSPSPFSVDFCPP